MYKSEGLLRRRNAPLDVDECGPFFLLIPNKKRLSMHNPQVRANLTRLDLSKWLWEVLPWETESQGSFPK
jgi:hypothetical protein